MSVMSDIVADFVSDFYCRRDCLADQSFWLALASIVHKCKEVIISMIVSARICMLRSMMMMVMAIIRI